jgi:diaminopimelate epimerase
MPVRAIDSMRLNFTKMQGLGNDFVVLQWPREAPGPGADQIRRLADRRRGIGFDQLLLLEPTAPDGADAAYRVFNADGGEVEQCGNGARCIARIVAGDRAAPELRLASAGGPVNASVDSEGRVSVSLGEPDFMPAALPFSAAQSAQSYRRTVTLAAMQPEGVMATTDVEFGAVSMGNPHAVIVVDSVDAAPVGILGPALAEHPDFPRSVNVGFMQICSRKRIRLRVHERGVGETPACGTGAAAAVAVGRMRGELDEQVDVELPGGVLTVRWPGPGAELWQTGPAETVYEGQIEL